MSSALRPHDLVWLAPVAGGRAGAGDAAPIAYPAWADAAWRCRAPAVVRRARAWSPGRVPLGLRGRARSERQAIEVDAGCVGRHLTPEAIAARWRVGAVSAAAVPAVPVAAAAAADRACLQALRLAAPLLDASDLPWGPTGGVGFMLASGLDVLRADSDLDLLVRIDGAADAPALHALGPRLAAIEHDAGCRIDVQVQIGEDAFALKEWLRTGGPVLLRGPDGPRLVASPWAPDAGDPASASSIAARSAGFARGV